MLPIKDDAAWAVCLQALDRIREDYFWTMRALARALRHRVHAPQWALIAYQDVASGFPEDKSNADRYSQMGHFGMAFISRLQSLNYRSTQEQVEKLLIDRERFLSMLNEVLERHDIDLGTFFKLDLAKTQIFYPRKAFRCHVLAEAVLQDGRVDVLGRSVSHMFHDNNVGINHEFVLQMDDKDALGRSSFHLACAMSPNERRTKGIDLTSTSVHWYGSQVLGLHPIAIAAIHGFTDILQHELAKGMQVEHWTEHSDYIAERTVFQWAACHGHLDVFKILFICCKDRSMTIADVSITPTHKLDTPLCLAVLHGHFDFVASVVAWTTRDLSEEKGYRRSLKKKHFTLAFILAIKTRNLDIMRLLEPLAELNLSPTDELTPLMEAAQIGFTAGVQFLLDKSVAVDILYENEEKRNFVLAKRTALDFAMQYGHDDCTKLLKEHGAKTWVVIWWEWQERGIQRRGPQ